jgi:simple sugar transport system substrate-binding protein
LRTASAAAALAVGGLPANACAADARKTAPFHQLLLLSNDWNTIIDDAAHRAAAILGLPYGSTTFNLNDGVALTQAQSAAAAGAKLFLINSVDGSGLRPIAQTAAQSGGFLVNVGSNLPWTSPFDDGAAYTQAFVTREDVGFYEAVRYTIGLIVQKKGPNARLLHITGPKGAFMDNVRTNSARRAVAEYPGVTIVGSLPGNWSAEDGQKAAEDLISRLGVPDGIIVQNDGSLTGVLAALRGLGIAAGTQVLCCGVDGSTDILRAIARGHVAATAFQSPAYHGIQAAARLYDALNGYQPSAPERLVGFAGLLVTRDNVAGVLKRYVDNPNLPFDPRLLSHVISGDQWDPQAPLVPLRYETYYAQAGLPQPKGWQPPGPYAESLRSGEFDRVTERYTNAYRLKLDDFGYAGVKV